jgi:hypothetical protein
MTDTIDPAAPRYARRLKDQKRIPLNLRITPRMRAGLERLASNNGRSLSMQTELLLEVALFRSFGDGLGEHYEPPTPPPSMKDLGDDLRRLWTDFAGLRAMVQQQLDDLRRLGTDFSGLRYMVEQQLDRNTEELAEARLYQLAVEFEAKLAANTTAMITEITALRDELAKHQTALADPRREAELRAELTRIVEAIPAQREALTREIDANPTVTTASIKAAMAFLAAALRAQEQAQPAEQHLAATDAPPRPRLVRTIGGSETADG